MYVQDKRTGGKDLLRKLISYLCSQFMNTHIYYKGYSFKYFLNIKG